MAYTRRTVKGIKHGDVGRSARPETCNTKWIRQGVEAGCKHNQPSK